MSSIERVRVALLKNGCEPKGRGNKWKSRCPAHDDLKPSLSITEGDDGRVLFHCHAGCSFDEIMRALDMDPGELAGSEESALPATRKRTNRSKHNGQATGRQFNTAQAAIASLERKLGKRIAEWTYTNADGSPVGMVLRWDSPEGGKEIRPIALHEGRWIVGGMPEPRPLYRLPELVDANKVYIVEGEKAADAARSLGIVATTSPHGSASANKADWAPLADKDCVILPDNDEAGRKYADDVQAILQALNPPAKVRRVDLLQLSDGSPMPKGGDIVDWIASHGDAAEPESMAATLAELVAGLAIVAVERTAEAGGRFRPFPTSALPALVRKFVVRAAKAIGCDASYIALPLLTMCAAAIGNTRRLRLKSGWEVPAIIWVALVGESGSAKTPAFKLALRPIRDRQRAALESHAEEFGDHEIELKRYEKLLAEWKRGDGSTDPPSKPVEPIAERFVVSDTTIEALAPILRNNPRGLLVCHDELAGWFGSFDRYKGRAGGDAAHWLSMHNAETIIVDRKSAFPPTISVPQASVSVCGGIQPGILQRVLGAEHRESGLAARLLLTWPPRKPKRWTESDIDPAAEAEIKQLVDNLHQLDFEHDADGKPTGKVIHLTVEAKEIWTKFFDTHADEQVDLSGDLSAAWSKLEEYAPRLALVIHFVRWASCDPTLVDVDHVDAVSMRAGIQLVEWFKGEARRVYGMLMETDGDAAGRRLLEWIERKGGTVTSRDVQKGCAWLKRPGEAEAALRDLRRRGFGNWDDRATTSSGGRPTRVFTVASAITIDDTNDFPEEEKGSVDVDTPAESAPLELAGDVGEI